MWLGDREEGSGLGHLVGLSDDALAADPPAQLATRRLAAYSRPPP